MFKKKLIMISINIIILSILLSSCQFNTSKDDKREYAITNINIFKDTPVWELAIAVSKEKTETIENIEKSNSNLLNYQESKYGASLLLWAIGMEKYNSAEALLKSGANPNIVSKRYKTFGEETPLSRAAGFSWVDNDAKDDPKYVKLLLKYGADPNWTFIGHEYGMEPGTSILMQSIRCGIEKTRALVEAGADINYKMPNGNTAAINALDACQNSTIEAMEYAKYLIVEKKASISDPYYLGKSYGLDDPIAKLYPVSILRNCVYDLDSDSYKLKMEIVEEFTRQGVNYWDVEINQFTLEQIKKLYPSNWEEYIKKY